MFRVRGGVLGMWFERLGGLGQCSVGWLVLYFVRFVRVVV